MSESMIKIHNVTTNEVVERKMTAEELTQVAIDEANFQAQKETQAAKAHEKAALLAKLGITEEEARLLLGGN